MTLDHRGILDGGAVARIDPHAVDLDRTGGRDEIAVTLLAKRVVDGLAGLQRGAEHARLGADWQRVGVLIEAARERHEAPRAVALRKGLRTPGRRTAPLRRHDPDLENSRRPVLEIVFGVADAGPALITCTSPASVRPSLPRLSLCVMAPSRT